MTDTEALLAAAIIQEHNLSVLPAFMSTGEWAQAKAKRILATPSGQRLLAPSERERALTSATLALDIIVSYLRDHDDGLSADWMSVMSVAEHSHGVLAALAQPQASPVEEGE